MTTLQLNASQHTKSKQDQLLFNNPERQGRIKGGALWASARGPALSGAPQIFWASRFFMAPCFRDRTARFWADISYM